MVLVLYRKPIFSRLCEECMQLPELLIADYVALLVAQESLVSNLHERRAERMHLDEFVPLLVLPIALLIPDDICSTK